MDANGRSFCLSIPITRQAVNAGRNLTMGGNYIPAATKRAVFYQECKSASANWGITLHYYASSF
jgi:hypothetical protein